VAEEKKSPGKLMALLAFLPWLVYIFASGGNHWGVATAGGTIMCVVYLIALSRQTTVKLMDWTTLAYFVTASILMIGLRSTALPTYQVMVIWSFYAVAGWRRSWWASRSPSPTRARSNRPRSGIFRSSIGSTGL